MVPADSFKKRNKVSSDVKNLLPFFEISPRYNFSGDCGFSDSSTTLTVSFFLGGFNYAMTSWAFAKKLLLQLVPNLCHSVQREDQ
jgi:hypothetical protein